MTITVAIKTYTIYLLTTNYASLLKNFFFLSVLFLLIFNLLTDYKTGGGSQFDGIFFLSNTI